MSEEITEETNEFAETSTDNTEKVDSDTEEIASDTEKTEFNTEKIAELIAEKIRIKGHRGLDKGPRKYNPNSLRNLKQYQNIIAEDTENSNNGIWIFVGIIILVIGILIWRIYEWWKEKRQSENPD